MRFVIVSHQGAGTNLLRNLLSSNEYMGKVHGEIFDKDDAYDKAGRPEVGKFLNDLLGDGDDITGFTLMYNQFFPQVLEWIWKENVKVVHFLRSPLRTYFKELRPGETFTSDAVIRHAENVVASGKVVNNWPVEVLNLRYEALTGGELIELGDEVYNDAVGKLEAFLGISQRHLELSEDPTNINLSKKFHV